MIVVRPESHGLINAIRYHGLQNQVVVPSQGMGDSIAAGVAATPEWGGWIICLADMPFVSVAQYREIYEASIKTNDGIVRPIFEGVPGHPVYFSKNHYTELIKLKRDEGARQIIDKHRSSLRLLPVQNKSVIRDIDTPQDLQA